MNDRKTYFIQKVNDPATAENVFSTYLCDAKPLVIDNYLWMENDYKPRTEVRLLYSKEYLFTGFKVFEKEITATYTEINSPVYKDSCVEAFLSLEPERNTNYFNFEINAIGTIYAAFGKKGKRKVLSVEEISRIKIYSALSEPFTGQIENLFWEIKLAVPFKLLSKYFEIENGKEMYANFYKCGDETKEKHYGVWSPVVSDKPDFHLPQYFGKLIFGKSGIIIN